MTDSLKKKTLSGFAWKLAERMLAQLVSLIVSIVLARLLSPEDYSPIGVVSIFFVFGNVLISGGLNTALIQKKEADIDDYNTILHICFFTSIIIYVLLFVFAPVIAQLFKQDILSSVIRVMGLILIVNSIKSILCAYISNRLEFRKFFLATLIGTVASAIIGITMALNGFGVWALVAQQMTNAILDTLILFLVTKFKIVFKISRKKFFDLFGFGWKMLLSSILDAAYTEARPLLIGLKFSTTDLAFYKKGENFPKLANSVTTETFSAVMFPVMSKVQDDKEKLLNYTRRFISSITFVVFPIMIGLFVISDNFVSVLLTDKWMEASIYIKIFCFAYMFSIIQSANIQALQAIGRSDVVLRLNIIKKIAFFIVIIACIVFANNPIYVAYSTIATTLIATVVNTFPNRKLIGYRYRYQFMDIAVNLLLAIMMGVLVYFMNYLPINKILLLIIQIFTGAAVYFLLSFITKNKSFRYFVDTCMNLLKRGDDHEQKV